MRRLESKRRQAKTRTFLRVSAGQGEGELRGFADKSSRAEGKRERNKGERVGKEEGEDDRDDRERARERKIQRERERQDR